MIQNRQPAGVPAGGQFTSATSARASVDLGTLQADRDAESRASRDHHDRGQLLTVKSLGAYLRQHFPMATMVRFGEGDQSEDDVYVNEILDADGHPVASYEDDLDHYLEISDAAGSLSMFTLDDLARGGSGVVEKTGGRRSPVWTLDVAKAAELEIDPQPATAAISREGADHIAAVQAEFDADEAELEQLAEATNNWQSMSDVDHYYERRDEIHTKRAEQLADLLAIIRDGTR